MVYPLWKELFMPTKNSHRDLNSVDRKAKESPFEGGMGDDKISPLGRDDIGIFYHCGV